jgi:hypothetical protein
VARKQRCVLTITGIDKGASCNSHKKTPRGQVRGVSLDNSRPRGWGMVGAVASCQPNADNIHLCPLFLGVTLAMLHLRRYVEIWPDEGHSPEQRAVVTDHEQMQTNRIASGVCGLAELG